MRVDMLEMDKLFKLTQIISQADSRFPDGFLSCVQVYGKATEMRRLVGLMIVSIYREIR